MTGGENRAFRLSPALRAGVRLTLGAWMLLAAFPLFWILVMSFKLPVDAFAPNPMSVVFGPATRKSAGGISALDIAALIGAAVWLWKIAPRIRAKSRAASLLFFPAAAVFFIALLFAAGAAKDVLAGAPVLGLLAEPLVGLTFQHYRAVWVEDAFYREFFNSAVITLGVVCLSLSIGAPAGYALARSRSQLAFWILVAALVFRALPHSVLITGYLQPFIDYGLYGKRIAVVIVLAAINQPFTIWMLSSFFASIPAELDESALVDGCTRLQAFRRVVMPVAWPGIYHNRIVFLPARLQRLSGHRAAAGRRLHDDGAFHHPLLQPGDDHDRPSGGGCGGGFHHRAAVCLGDGFSAADCLRPDAGGGEGMK